MDTDLLCFVGQAGQIRGHLQAPSLRGDTTDMAHTVELEIAGRMLKLETGHLAKQADGSVLATYCGT